ncbi:hypothetical protein [Neobacillus jeddahensis]|uniref:hypothetical protein n=1 Tax=Neobacillus jeddahensis TaxID=1461580 RepID=UPI00058D8BC1|nr:hypothetical protein [Neobacillus jeddahensis]
MLIDINLLPKRDEKNIASYVIVGSIVLVLIILAASVLFYLNDKQQDLQTIEKQVAQNQKIVDEQRQKLVDFQSSKSVVELEQAINWAKEQPFDMVYVLRDLTKALPQRGFILDWEIGEDQKIKQQVQFDTKSYAAYYLHEVLNIPWVDEAVIVEAKTSDIMMTTDGGETQTEVEPTETDVLPRYVATYEIRLDVSKLKKQIAEKNKKDKTEEGEDTP